MAFELITDLANLIMGLNKGSGYAQRKAEVQRFRQQMTRVVGGLQKESKTPQAKGAYARILHTLRNTEIQGMPGRALSKAGNVVTLGENIKSMQMRQNPYTKTWEAVRPSGREIILVPQQHLFRGGRITPQGALTLVHEITHGAVRNELLTDLVTARIAARGGIPKAAVLSHFAGRGVVYGRAGVKRAFGYADEAYKGAEARLAAMRRRGIVPRPVFMRKRPIGRKRF